MNNNKVFYLMMILFFLHPLQALSDSKEITHNFLVIQQQWENALSFESSTLRMEKLMQLREIVKSIDNNQYNDSLNLLDAELLMDIAEAKSNLDSLTDLDNARKKLQNCILSKNKSISSSSAALLGHLYYKVPSFPISFGDINTAKDYFSQALRIDSSNMEANYYFAAFLQDEGMQIEADDYFKRALDSHLDGNFSALEASYRNLVAKRNSTEIPAAKVRGLVTTNRNNRNNNYRDYKFDM
jgi:tetratricopeptide (TPR) repeat protein